MNNKVLPGRRSREPRTYTITVRLSDLIWMGVGAALALSIFFLFGLLIGRGYVAATPEEPVATSVRQAAVGEDANASAEPEKAPVPVVLQPEDLTYPEKLGQVEPSPKAEAKPEAKAEAPAEKPATKAEPAAKAEQAPAKTAEEAKTAQAEGEDAPGFAMTPPEPGESPYHYVYQCAAFKDPEQARELAGRLADKGMETKVSKGSVKGQTWHRVQVLFTGTPSQTVPLRDAIESVTKQKPIRVSKKPAS